MKSVDKPFHLNGKITEYAYKQAEDVELHLNEEITK